MDIKFLIELLIRSLPGILMAIFLSGFLFAILETNISKEKELSDNQLLYHQAPGIILIVVLFYFEISGFPWGNISWSSIVNHLAQVNLPAMLSICFFIGIAFTYNAFMFYRRNFKSLFVAHLIISVVLFYLSYYLFLV